MKVGTKYYLNTQDINLKFQKVNIKTNFANIIIKSDLKHFILKKITKIMHDILYY